MISRCSVYAAAGFDPYENLAAEQTLLERVGEGEMILYLWQNARTVVIGRNQNPWKECRTALLAEEGGHLARRLSGGGAVFHDLGNLNFTFLMREEDYDLSRQLSVIERACRSLGIPVERSGRNDLLADGRKFSGNAFYHHQGRAYHHGTLMVDVDLEMVQRYLSPSKAKLAAKGVDSVRSRVVNLKEFVPDLSIERLSEALISAFAAVYDCREQGTGNREQGTGEPVGTSIACPLHETEECNRQQATGDAITCGSGAQCAPRDHAAGAHSVRPPDEEPFINAVGAVIGRPPDGKPSVNAVGAVIGRPPDGKPSVNAVGAHSVRPPAALVEKYRSDAWLYGQKLPFTVSVEDRFPWGGVELQLQVESGVIRGVKVYTDAMDETLAVLLERTLSDSPFRSEALFDRISRADLPEPQKEDLRVLLRKAL